ncbi:hypothetical protein QE152_g35920 [Popillia japonica]|uniref:HTH psq-type domain-containing protein n=1 Tax=Popillia japonica TaxID=7064 RepID=A0AAW1IDX7_POPJA
MVRNYKRKSDRAKNYNKENIAQTLIELEGGLIIVHGASKKYKIPKTTLHDHLKGKHGSKSRTYCRGLVIPLEHEETLANGLKTLKRWGFGLSRKEVLLYLTM